MFIKITESKNRLGWERFIEAKSPSDKSGPCVVWMSGSSILGSQEGLVAAWCLQLFLEEVIMIL